MFENLQDTILLRCSLESALRSVVSNESQKNLCGLEDDNLKVAVSIVHGTVNKIIALVASQEKSKELEVSIHENRRLHAAVFYSALKSSGITSKDAENYYSSIHYIYPNLNWEFYIQLNKPCCWSEYFIECALQLPSRVLAEILKKMLELASEKKDQCYIWHMILQVLILKPFEKMLPCKEDFPFNFQYTNQDAAIDIPNNCLELTSLHPSTKGDLVNTLKASSENIFPFTKSSELTGSSVASNNLNEVHSDVNISNITGNLTTEVLLDRSVTVANDNPSEPVKSELLTHIVDNVNDISSVEKLDVEIVGKPYLSISNSGLSTSFTVTRTDDSLKTVSSNHSISKVCEYSDLKVLPKSPIVDSCNTYNQKTMVNVIVNSEQASDSDYRDDSLKCSLNLFKDLYNNMRYVMESEQENLDFVKVLLHGWKTLCRMLNQITYEDEFIHMCDILKDFYLLYDLLKESLVQNACHIAKASDFTAPKYSLCSYFYVTTSWEIDMIYLIFVLLNYWKDILSKCEKISVEELDFNPNFYCKIKDRHAYGILKNLNQFDEDYLVLSDDSSKHISLLMSIIKYSYPCCIEAAKILLSHPVIFERNEVLSIMEESFTSQKIEHLYSAFIKAVGLSTSQESRFKLLKAFFKMLLQCPTEIYNRILMEILTTCGETNKFKLPDFNTHISQFLRKTLSVQEAETIVLPLFIQSPIEVLKCVVQQAVLQGAGGNALIKVLKHVPVVCHYQMQEDGMPLLLEELQNCFAKDDLKRTEEKSILNLIKVLLEVHIEKELFSVDILIAKCIIPALSPDDVSEKTINLNLERLNIILKMLFQKKALKISSEALMLLVKCICHIIHISIESGNGKLKELAICSLSILKDYNKETKTLNDEHKSSLKTEFSHFNPAINLYASEFLQMQLDLNSFSSHHLWIWSCITKDTSIVKNKFSALLYEDLVNILIQVLPHFTKDEWLQSSQLISIYFKESASENDPLLPSFPFKNSDCDVLVYNIVKCFLESLHFLFQMDNMEFLQICVHFSNTIMNILQAEEKLGPRLLMALYLDLCYFAIDTKLQEMTVFTSLLLELKKKILSSCTDEVSKQEFRKILSHSMAQLRQTSEEKSSQLD